jgi:hypothetical protein
MPVLPLTNEVIAAYVMIVSCHDLYSNLYTLKWRTSIPIRISSYMKIVRASFSGVVRRQVRDMTNELGPDDYVDEFLSGSQISTRSGPRILGLWSEELCVKWGNKSIIPRLSDSAS